MNKRFAGELRPRIVRVGGSLLEDPLLTGRVREWLAAQPPAPNILIVGGGPWVEAVRAAFATHRLSETAAHWLSIRAMGLTARLALELWPGSVLLTELAAARTWRRLDVPAVFDVQRLMEDDAALGPEAYLPQDWSVTSDSIAALAARRVSAAELVLLKSDLPRPPLDLISLAEQGYVDACFPLAAREMNAIRCINLRASGFPECPLERGDDRGTEEDRSAAATRDMLR